MQSLGAYFETIFQLLAQPLHLAMALAGSAFGLLLAPVARRCGLRSAVLLVLALPAAALLDPTMGLMLLGAMFAAGIGLDTGPDSVAPQWRTHMRFVLAAGVIAVAWIAIGDWAAGRLDTLSDGDKIAILLAGAAASVIVAAVRQPSAWPAAVVLCAAGLALQVGPWPPLFADAGSQLPLPLLIGLLVAGPALIAAVRSSRIGRTAAPSQTAESVLTVLPVLSVGVPVTLAAAIFVLNSEDYGLQLGPHMMVQRPKLVIALVVAVLLAALVAALARSAGQIIPRPAWVHKISAPVTTRLAAAVMIALASYAVYQAGIDREGEWTGFEPGALSIGAVGMALGAIAAWWAIDLAPLAVALVIGRLLQPLLVSSLDETQGAIASVISAASLAVLIGAGGVISAALAWPLLMRLRPQRITP